MMGSGTGRLRVAILACGLCVAAPLRAQGHPGGAPGGGSGMGGQRSPSGSPDQRGGPPGGLGDGGRGGILPPAGSARAAGLGGSLQAGPMGRWWDDKEYARALGLRPGQKKKMDAIFNENRSELTQRYQALVEQESQLAAATRDTRLSQAGIFGQIDRVAQARDALEKVNARLYEELRKELDADQAARVQSLK